MSNQIEQKIVGSIQFKQASSFFINGPPGAGKSYLLKRLSEQLPGLVPGMCDVCGPYAIKDNDLPWAGPSLLDYLWKAGYLTINPSECQHNDLANIWHWIGRNCSIPQLQTFIVLIDLPHLNDENLSAYCEFLSNIRSLDANWNEQQIRLCHILTGFWDSERIKANAQQMGISFPYTEAENFIYWQGVSPTELAIFVNEDYPDLERIPVIQAVLYEITDGNPALARQILSTILDDNLNFTTLITAAKVIAEKSESLVVQSVQHLDEKSKGFLGELLIDQYLPSRLYSPYRNRLLASGLVKEELLGKETYIRFRSWFYEMIVRLHGHAVGIPQQSVGKIRVNEMMPLIRYLNLELYRLINDIEIQARNFVVIQLSLRQNNNQPLLSGLLEEIDRKSDSVNDAQQRAEVWRNKARKNIAFSDLNPIISYLSTRDLSNIIKELSSIYGVSEWREIGRAIYDMADIRDAVMHNQLVNDAAINHLYKLQIQIYSTLAQIKKG